jgi:hypothetical protein
MDRAAVNGPAQRVCAFASCRIPSHRPQFQSQRAAVVSEQGAMEGIDALLSLAGWVVSGASAANIHEGRGAAIRRFPIAGLRFYRDPAKWGGKAAGVLEAKIFGRKLSDNETPHCLDAPLLAHDTWNVPRSAKSGNEISTARHFHTPQHLQPLAEIPTNAWAPEMGTERLPSEAIGWGA